MGKVEELKQTLVTACRILDAEGIVDELGHFSVRIPGQERMIMNGRISPGQATEEDMVILDLNGRKLEGRLDPPKESPLHLVLYQRRPDVMAVTHTHSPYIVALSIVGARLQAVNVQGAIVFGESVPVFEEFGMVDTLEAANRLADTMGSHNLLVIRNHGNLVAGSSIEAACVSAIWAEKSACLQYQAMAVGKPQVYPGDEIRKIQKQMAMAKGFDRTWNYYRWRLERR